MNVSGTLQIWSGTGSAVNLTDGNLSVGTLDPQGVPTSFNWTGGNLTKTTSDLIVGSNGGVATPLGNSLSLPFGKNLNVPNGETVAFTATGSISQSGGNNTAPGVDIAEEPGSSGTYSISSGSLNLAGNSV